MDQLVTILNIALAVAAITAVGGVGFLRGTVTNLRGQLQDADREISKLKEKRVEDRALIEQQAADIGALQRLKTGQDSLVRLDALLREHNQKAFEHWQREERMFNHVTKRLDAIFAKVVKIDEDATEDAGP